MDILHHKTLSVPIEVGVSVVSAHVDVDEFMLLGEEQEDEAVSLE